MLNIFTYRSDEHLEHLDLEHGAALAVLQNPIELEVELCPACGRPKTKFVIEFVFVNGFFGTYVCCGDERVAAFTRTVAAEAQK
jgi:hypothetical protein